MGMYRKRPVQVEARQWTGWNTSDVVDWIIGAGTRTARWHEETAGDAQFLAIDTLEGTMRADVGDWIIAGVAGEFYPCKPEIFAATYEEVTD